MCHSHPSLTLPFSFPDPVLVLSQLQKADVIAAVAALPSSCDRALVDAEHATLFPRPRRMRLGVPQYLCLSEGGITLSRAVYNCEQSIRRQVVSWPALHAGLKFRHMSHAAVAASVMSRRLMTVIS